MGLIHHDGTAYPTREYLADYPHQLFDKIRRRDEPYGFKPGIDVQWPM